MAASTSAEVSLSAGSHVRHEGMMNTLGELLIEHTDEIVGRWLEAWRCSRHPHPELSAAALKDHLPAQLRLIGEQLCKLDAAEDPEDMWKIGERLEPEARVGQEVLVEEVVQEYRIFVGALRAWLEERDIEPTFEQYSYIYEAIFELTAESVRRYTEYQATAIARERAEYLAGLTHQMRNPLAAISAQVKMLEVGRAPDAKTVDILARNTRRLELMVGGVMRLERFAHDEIPVRPRMVRVARLIDQVLDEHASEACHKGLRLEVALNRSLQVRIDPELFLDIMGNLVHNAVKFTDQGFVRVTADEEPETVCFTVTDSGPGIDPQRQAALFEPIVPGKPGGVGIGLAVAKRAVLAQQGESGVISTVGQGSQFWFRLPRRVTPHEEPEPSAH